MPVHALVGAGVSRGVGLPDWEGLLQELDAPPQRARKGRTTRTRREVLREGSLRARDDMAERDLPWRAQLVEQKLGRNALRRRLKRRFWLAPGQPVSPTVRSLVSLPFHHFLTTNYDNLLDLAHAQVRAEDPWRVLRWEVPGEREHFVTALGRATHERFFLHLHGRADTPDSCVFTENDYRERYVRSHALSRHLFALFASQIVVFVGFSLSDPDFVTILREVQALGGGAPRHYAILPRPKEGEAGLAAYLTSKYGVFPILYPNEDGKHAGLHAILTDLGNVSRERTDWAEVEVERASSKRRRKHQDDPNAGHFGGKATAGGFTLRLADVKLWDDDWATLELEVRDRSGKPPRSPVAFYLHPTFPERVIRVPPGSRRCLISVAAWGAFTVGAVVAKPRVLLELDLAREKKLPKAFRER